jgi:hypothetical protein
LHLSCARRYGWTPEQVDSLDPDYVDELIAMWEAEAAHENRTKPKAEHTKKHG